MSRATARENVAELARILVAVLDFLVLSITGKRGQELICSRFLRNDLAILPNVNRRSVHARGFACDLCGAAQGAPDRCRELFAVSRIRLALHCERSSKRGLLPELSYTLHVSAKSL